MRPAKVLGIDMGYLSPAVNWWGDFDPDTLSVCTFDDLDEPTLREFFDGLDVVWMAETPYRYEALHLAREMGIITYVHANYELCKWIPEPDLPRPDVFLFPADWMRDHWPQDSQLLPFPVARDRLPSTHRTEARAFTHIIGRPAIHDRNGTELVLQALPFLTEPTHLIIRSQGPFQHVFRTPSYVQVDVVQADVANYWDLYEDTDVLVMPRRYGGLSLPMQEAASLGMAVITTDLEPQNGWFPADSLVPASLYAQFRTPVGRIDIHACDPRDLAAKMDEFSRDPGLMQWCSKTSDLYAQTISWTAMQPRYEELFG